MTTQELLEEYGFKDLDEVKLIIRMAFPSVWRRAWIPVYPSAAWVISALSFLRTYLATNSIDTMIKWAKRKEE